MDGMEVNLSRAIDFFYPSSSSLELVYFEAIANAIDAGANNIQISIAVDSYSKPESLTIVISDNGVGFTNDRYRKFTKLLETKDSDDWSSSNISKKFISKAYLRNKFGSLRSRRTLRKTISLSLRLLMPLIRAADWHLAGT